MAILNRDGKENSGPVETIIGQSVQVEGNFIGEGDVTVEGAVSGTLKTGKNLIIGAAAKIKADIEAENISVAGEIHGNVLSRGKLELSSTARIIGNIRTSSMSIETGAILHGKCQMADKKVSQEEEADTTQDQKDKE